MAKIILSVIVVLLITGNSIASSYIPNILIVGLPAVLVFWAISAVIMLPIFYWISRYD